jgi:hypothetical protein
MIFQNLQRTLRSICSLLSIAIIKNRHFSNATGRDKRRVSYVFGRPWKNDTYLQKPVLETLQATSLYLGVSS